jgi:hypothetical protein
VSTPDLDNYRKHLAVPTEIATDVARTSEEGAVFVTGRSRVVTQKMVPVRFETLPIVKVREIVAIIRQVGRGGRVLFTPHAGGQKQAFRIAENPRLEFRGAGDSTINIRLERFHGVAAT